MTNSPEEQRWSLQGQLVGQWAAELRSTWRKAQIVGDTRKCIVELIEVTSIDRNGEEALSEIMSQGAEVNATEYDLVVIGSGPAGQKGAIAAAKARKSVAVIERTGMIGGVSVHTGTIPSKTVREAIFQLSGLAVSALYGAGSRGRVDISVESVTSRF